MPDRLLVGLASGSACDGVDAVLACIRGRRERIRAEQLHHVFRPFGEDLRDRLMRWSGLISAPARGGPAGRPLATARALAELDRDVGAAFAEAAERLIEQSHADRSEIAAIGSSGQTLVRTSRSKGSGLGGLIQVGSAAVIAQKARLAVVSGFAASDVAAGGCGGPITAWADWRLLRHRRLSRVALHLGGIAGLVFVGSNALADDVIAFDVGPGTIVIDPICREHFQCDFDADGAIAARGRVHAEILQNLLSNRHFAQKPPKAASPEQWGWVYRERLATLARKHRCKPVDLLATVTELTARTVARAVAGLTERPHEVALSGGGGRNIHLAGRVRSLLSPSSTYTFERYGPDLRGKQAVCMAMLAAARLDKFAAHCPAATGATRPAVLGSVTLP